MDNKTTSQILKMKKQILLAIYIAMGGPMLVIVPLTIYLWFNLSLFQMIDFFKAYIIAFCLGYGIFSILVVRWLKPFEKFALILEKTKEVSKEKIREISQLAYSFPAKLAFSHSLMWANLAGLMMCLFSLFTPSNLRMFILSEVIVILCIGIGYGITCLFIGQRYLIPIFKLISFQAQKMGLEEVRKKRLNMKLKVVLIVAGVAIPCIAYVASQSYTNSITMAANSAREIGPIVTQLLVKEVNEKIGQEGFSLENLEPIIKKPNISGREIGFLADREGEIVIEPKEKLIIPRLKEFNQKLIGELKRGQGGMFYDNVGERIIFYQPTADNQYLVGTIFHFAKTTGLQTQLFWLVAVFIGWLSIFTAIFGTFGSASILEPLKEVTGVIKRVGIGDLNVRAGVVSPDEIGDLANFINQMTINLKEAKDNLEQSKAETENIIQSQTDLVFMIDNQGIIRKVNQAVLKILGYKEKELIGKSAAIAFHPDTLEQNLEAGPKKVLRGEQVINSELNLMTKAGEKLPLSFNGTPLRDAQGKIIGGVGVGRDLREIGNLISQLREAKVGLEEKVKERTKELEEKVKELERFNKIAMGRELRIAELKEEIAKLKEELKKGKKT